MKDNETYDTNVPLSLETFQRTCKRNFLCLQRTCLDFRAAANLVEHYHALCIRPRDSTQSAWCFQRSFSHTTMTFYTTRHDEFDPPNYTILLSVVFELFL